MKTLVVMAAIVRITVTVLHATARADGKAQSATSHRHRRVRVILAQMVQPALIRLMAAIDASVAKASKDRIAGVMWTIVNQCHVSTVANVWTVTIGSDANARPGLLARIVALT